MRDALSSFIFESTRRGVKLRVGIIRSHPMLAQRSSNPHGPWTHVIFSNSMHAEFIERETINA